MNAYAQSSAQADTTIDMPGTVTATVDITKEVQPVSADKTVTPEGTRPKEPLITPSSPTPGVKVDSMASSFDKTFNKTANVEEPPIMRDFSRGLAKPS